MHDHAETAAEDDRYMNLALELARRGGTLVAPNPQVGAVLVRNGRILGEGWHERYGGPHAEDNAVRNARERGVADLRGATLYVTLEPCSHRGKTPPCADLVIQCGVGRVVYGMQDPNPAVSGRGLERLSRAGIRAEPSGLEFLCRALNRPFVKHVTTGHPFITLKTALSLDGKTATASGESRWISGEESRSDAHRLRGESGAVLCGIGTVLSDDPALTARGTVRPAFAPPVRVIADSRLRIPESSTVVRTAGVTPTWVMTAERALEAPEAGGKLEALRNAGVTVIPVPADARGRLDLRALSAELGRRGINSALLEGGAALAGGALEAGIVDRIRYYLAPTLLGGDGALGAVGGSGCGPLAAAWRLEDIVLERLGADFVIDARVDYSGRRPCSPV